MKAKFKVLIFIVSYNAEAFIHSVLLRIPEAVWENADYSTELLIIDDQSSDHTSERVKEYIHLHPERKIKFFCNPENQGYGGNQKLGYHYAIINDFDMVVLLHGDGQYAPELLDEMIQPILKNEADIVIGSRMINRLDALKGGMPLYKWVGNQTLTTVQNALLRSSLSEFHSGYRAYSTRALRQVPFEYNANYFDFDTEILIQMIDTKQRIREIPIPTYYGKEICYVNGMKYGYLILLSTIRSRIVHLNLLYDQKFDYDIQNTQYTLKLGFASSHQFALDHVSRGMTVIDIGCGPGYMAAELYRRGINVISIDRYITAATRRYSSETFETNIEQWYLLTANWDRQQGTTQ